MYRIWIEFRSVQIAHPGSLIRRAKTADGAEAPLTVDVSGAWVPTQSHAYHKRLSITRDRAGAAASPPSPGRRVAI